MFPTNEHCLQGYSLRKRSEGRLDHRGHPSVEKYTNAVYPVRERKQTCKHIDYTMFQRKPPRLLVGQCRLILGQTLSYFNNFGRFFMKDVGLK